MAVDLHIHTNISDGIYTPAEVVNEAKKAKLEAIAITDHDAVAGIAMAEQVAEAENIEIVPGVELSSCYKNSDLHILGYCIDPMNQQLLNCLSILREARKNRAIEIIAKLFKLGIKLDLKELTNISGHSLICRPHIAQAMVTAGVVKNREEAFDKYIGFGKPAYVIKEIFSPIEAVKLILAAGGVPVLAHPGIGISKQNIALIDELIIAGIKGIEVYHPDHTGKQVKLYTKIAKKNNLIITGGSDFHGFSNKKKSLIGMFPVSYTAVEELKKFTT